MSDGFVMELCGNRAAWQIDLEEIDSIDLDVVGARIESDGYEVGIRIRLGIGIGVCVGIGVSLV